MELSMIAKKEIAVVPFDMSGIREIYAEILAAQAEVGGTVTYRAKVATGGGKSFEILTGDEESDTSVTKITGVVIHSHKCNAYFDENASGEPPTCSSIDGKYGTNRENGETTRCEGCPLNQFGTSSKGSGKACKNMVRLYIMTEFSPIPLLLTLPPTSIVAWQDYRTKVLALRVLKPTDVMTEFTLTPKTSKTGNKYSVVNIKLAGKLSPEGVETARFFAQGFLERNSISSVALSAEDYNTVGVCGELNSQISKEE